MISGNGSRGAWLGLLPAPAVMSMWCCWELRLSSDREVKMLWELFPCSDWEILKPLCWKGHSECGIPVPSPAATARLRDPLCWVTLKPGTRRKPWNARVLDWECQLNIPARQQQGSSGFLLPALSLSHFQAASRGPCPVLLCCFPFCACHGEPQDGVEGWRRWMEEQLEEDGVPRALGTRAALG